MTNSQEVILRFSKERLQVQLDLMRTSVGLLLTLQDRRVARRGGERRHKHKKGGGQFVVGNLHRGDLQAARGCRLDLTQGV